MGLGGGGLAPAGRSAWTAGSHFGCPSETDCTNDAMTCRARGGRLAQASRTVASEASTAAEPVAFPVTLGAKLLFSRASSTNAGGLQIRHRRFDSDRSLFLLFRAAPEG